MKLTTILIGVLMVLAFSSPASATWWNASWDHRIPVEINNTAGGALVDYQINVTLSPGVNATSLRVVNATSGTTVPHWNETIVSGGATEMWFLTDIPAGMWCNDTYYIYYGNDAVSTTSDYDNTFTKTYNNSGMVLELHMDEGSGNATTYDSSGHGNNGTLTNMNVTGNTTSGWQGVDGGQWDNRSIAFSTGDHLQLDGDDDYVDCGDDASLNITDALSMSAWVKTSYSSGHQGVISKNTAASGWVDPYLIRIGATSGKVFCRIGSGLGENSIIGDTDITDGAWHHVVFTYDANYLNLYIDNVSDATPVAKTISVCTTADNLEIGNCYHGFLQGYADEVRIYNRSLSEDEIGRQFIRSKYAADAPVPTLGVAQSQPVPPTPISLANTTGNFWVNHTWAHGTGNVTDSYNVSVNDVWHNTTNTFYNDTYSAHAWQNITVWAYNNTGFLSVNNVGQNTQIPNNGITITNASDWSGDEGETVYVDYDATDPDSDTPTFSCNRTDLFTDFSTVNGNGNWTTTSTDSGIYYVDFGVSDGWGSTSNYMMTITVNRVLPPAPVNLANTTGFLWVNHTWAHGTGNVTDSYNVSVNDVWHNTTNTFYNDTYLPSEWQNITVWAYNASGDEVSTDNVSQNTQAPPAIDITLLSQTPADLFQNSTGYFNQTWGISHAYPLNESAITYIYHNRFDGDAHHSLRMPINNRTETGWRGDHRNETGSNRLLMEDNPTIFGDGYYNWSAGDIEHNVRMHVVNMNATYTIINFNNSASGTIFSSSWYLDKSDMINATKTTLQISKQNARLVKIYDPEMIRARDRNYTVSIWIDTVDNAQSISNPMSIWWANASFDPDGGVCITDSPYAVQMGTIADTDWENTSTIPHTGNYMKFSVYAGQNPDIQPTNVSYLYFEHDWPRPYYFNATDANTSTNTTFADSQVMWTSSKGSSTYTLDPYTPNIFLTFHRGNQTFGSQLWAKDTGGNLTGSDIEQTAIQTSNYPPTAGSFDHFGFAGYNDTNMDCVYRDNITIAYTTSADPDGGNVTCNLTLCYANGTHVATINDSAVLDSPTQFEFEFNTTPYYSTTELYTLKAVCTDDESDTVTYWLPADFACSPLATSGAIYNGLPTTPRVLFWGINDIPSLYSTVANDSLISLSGGIYMMHCTFHHGQHADDFAVNETIRIISSPEDTTPFFRFTGTDDFNGAHIVAWNTTLYAPAQRGELFRSHVASDEYYSRVNMTNCNLSYLGHGADQYRGVYMGNAEGATFDNNTFIDNYNGLYIIGGGNFTITNNTITNPLWKALFVTNTNGNASVRDNIIHSDIQTSGIRMINGGCDNEFINNTITGTVESGFYTRYVNDSLFQYNTIHGTQFGLTLSSGNQNLTIIDNDIEVHDDAEGHPAWGIMILSGTHNISNNIINVDNGYGMDVANWYTDVPCVNSLFANNSITITPGYHSEGGQFVHYLFEAKYLHNTTGNIIRNPPATTSSFRIADTWSNVLIENTDNTAFTEDSDCITIARPENFSMFVNTTTLFNVTRVGMVVTPATSALNIWNLVYGNDVTFNASTDTPADQVWFNFTNMAWADRNITVYRNNTEYYNDTANETGVFDYYYTGGWSEKYFAFIRGATIPVSEVVTPANGATGTSTNPTLSVVVTDGDGGPCDVTFYQYGGSQIGATQTGIANGSTASVIWSGRSYSTTYQWYVVADNGMETGQSSTWHFTTQGSGSGSSHTIFITGCTDWSGNAGSQVYIDFGVSGETAGATFTTTATQGAINPSTGVYVWDTNVTDAGTYTWRFDVENVYANSDYCDVTITVHHHASPVDLTATTGNFWVDHTWSGNGFVDSYNVSVNGVWTNGSAAQSYYHVRTPHAWSNISVAAYNLTTGLSSFISNDVHVPNNPIHITNYNELMLVTVGDTATVDMDHEDLDGDTATYSCSRTDLFTDFSTVNGTGHYTNAANGTYDVIFGVTDGYVWSNVTVTIEVGAVHPLELDEEMPLILFVVLIVILFAALFYIYHAESYVARIVTSLITVWMSFMLSNMSVSGNVVINYAELSSGDTFVYGTHSIQIAALSHFFMFIGVVSALFMFVFVVKLVIEIYSGIDAEKKEEEEWDGVDR